MLLAVAALAGCGSGGEPAGPRLPGPLAASLAARADALAAAANGCAAQRALAALRRGTIAAINAHRVPPAFQEELLAAVNRLTAPACVRPAAAAPAAAAPVRAAAPRGRAKGPGKKHGKPPKHPRHGRHGRHGKHGR